MFSLKTIEQSCALRYHFRLEKAFGGDIFSNPCWVLQKGVDKEGGGPIETS
jgi:hypothetical protein